MEEELHLSKLQLNDRDENNNNQNINKSENKPRKNDFPPLETLCEFINNNKNYPFDISQNKLGSGYFGIIVEGIYEGKDVAVKFVNVKEVADTEFSIQVSLHHPNVTEAYFYGEVKLKPSSCYFLVMEKMEMSLSDALELGLLPTSASLQKVALQVVEGMMYLQRKGIVHGDLHTGNILLRRSVNDEMIAKLSDFGLSFVIPDQFDHIPFKGYVKSPVRAPETCEGNVVHRNSDIYAFGCMLCKLFDAEFDERNQNRQVPFGCPDEMRSLIKACWAEDPAKRPSWNTIYQALTSSNMFKQEKTSINTVNLPVGKNGYVDDKDDNPSNNHRGYLQESIESGLE